MGVREDTEEANKRGGAEEVTVWDSGRIEGIEEQ
jgi:hypothetical protein